MRRLTMVSLLGAALLLAITAGCGDDDGATTTTTVVEATTTTTVATTTVAATSTTAEGTGDELDDGVHFGYLTEITIGDATVSATFDLAQLLTGDEAEAAAAEDGAEFLGDFYIRNANPKLRPVTIAPDAEVIDIDYDDCCDGKATNIAAFAADLTPPTPVNLTVTGGVVTKVEELYFP